MAVRISVIEMSEPVGDVANGEDQEAGENEGHLRAIL
jgi:hypothetical protein